MTLRDPRDASAMADITQNSILRINDAKTLQLLDLYQKEECLWNTNSEHYKSRDKRVAAAERIAYVLNLRHFEGRHVMIKFKNLRNSYCQELKKIAHSLKSGAGPDDVYRPKVFWFPKMDSFLRPHLQPSRASGSVQNLFDDSSKEGIGKQVLEKLNKQNEVFLSNPPDLEEPDDPITLMSRTQDPGHSDVEVKIEVSSSSDEEQPTPKPERNLASKRKSCTHRPAKQPKVEERTNDHLELLKKISSRLDIVARQSEDHFDSFGKYIASLLRNLPPQKALELQPRIMSLVTSAIIIGNSEGRVSQSDELS